MRVLTRFNRSIERLDGMSRSTRPGNTDQHPHPNRRWEDRPMGKPSSIEKAMAAGNSSTKEGSTCAK